MEFGILGPTRVTRDGHELALGGGKPRSLLCLLIVHGNRPVPVERLAEELWEGDPPERAVASLRVQVARLRKILGPDRLLTRLGGYELVMAVGELDAAAFEADLTAGHAALTRRDASGGLDALTRGLGRWRGDALTDAAGATWAAGEATRLEELRLVAEEAVLDARLELGQHADVVSAAEAAVAEAPLRERRWAQLIIALYRSGRQAEALRGYERLRTLLAEELGISPSEELVALERAVLGHDPLLDRPRAAVEPEPPDAPVGLPPELGTSTGSFVGREASLAELQEALERARAGALQLTLVAGEPGAGKSRLAAEFAKIAHREGVTVLHGNYDEELLLPYQGLVQAFRHLVRSSERRRADVVSNAPELARLLPEIRRGDSAREWRRDRPSDSDRYQLFVAIETVLLDAAASAPVLLVVDDLQWADSSTVLLLKHLTRSQLDAPIMILATYRDTELGRSHRLTGTIAQLRSSPGFSQLRLAPLDEEDVVTMASAVIADPGAARELGRAVHARANGNALFAEALIAELAASVRNGRPVPFEEVRLSENVREIVNERVARLSEAALRILDVAAVLGSEFDFDVVQDATGLDEQAVVAAVQEVVEGRLLADVPVLSGAATRGAFRHAVVRDAVYGELEGVRRAHLHQRVAAVLERRYAGDDDRAAELAHHYAAAPRTPESSRQLVEHARRAGHRLMAQYAYELAARHFEAALDALVALPSPDELVRADLLVCTASALERSGEAGRARALCEEALVIAGARQAADLIGAAALVFEEATWTGDSFMAEPAVEGASTILHRALDVIGPERLELRAELVARMPRVLHFQNEPDVSRAYAEEAVDLAGEQSSPRLRAVALEAMRWALWGSGELERQLRVSDEMVLSAEAAGDLLLTLRGHIWRFLALVELADMDGAAREVDALRELGGQLRDPMGLWFPVMAGAMRALLEGRLGDAERDAFAAFDIAQRFDLRWAVASFGMQLFFLRREQGRLLELEEPTRAAAEERGDAPMWRCALADLYCVTGQTDQAAAEFDRLASSGFADIPRDLGWLVTVAILGTVCAALEDADRAPALYELLLPYADRNVMIGPAVVCTGSTSRVLGELATTIGDFGAADEHFRRGLHLNQSLEAAPWVARTHLGRAKMLLRRGGPGDDAQAATDLATATAIGEELGLVAVVAACRELDAGLA